MNEGNSPNSDECTETDDEGLCEAYAKISQLKVEVKSAFYECSKLQGWRVPSVDGCYENSRARRVAEGDLT